MTINAHQLGSSKVEIEVAAPLDETNPGVTLWLTCWPAPQEDRTAPVTAGYTLGRREAELLIVEINEQLRQA